MLNLRSITSLLRFNLIAAAWCGSALCTGVQAQSICPAPSLKGPGIGLSGQLVINGHLGKFTSIGPPIKFEDLDIKAQLSIGGYGATVTGNYAVPFTGKVNSIRIGGKSVRLKDGNLKTGCVDIDEVGPVLVLFTNSMMSQSAILVVTEDQLAKFK